MGTLSWGDFMGAEHDILKVIREAAVAAVKNTKPTSLHFGVVESEKPLAIRLNQKVLLTEEFLILSRNVTDYDLEMTVNHITEKMQKGGKDPSFTSHKHEYKGRKVFRVHKALKKDENVILIRVQGGTKYLVLDRVGVGL